MLKVQLILIICNILIILQGHLKQGISDFTVKTEPLLLKQKQAQVDTSHNISVLINIVSCVMWISVLKNLL